MFDQYSDGNILASSADKPYEEGMRKLLKFLEEQYGQTGTDASVSGSQESLCDSESQTSKSLLY